MVPALTTIATLQVNSTSPSSVTRNGSALTGYGSIAALTAAGEGWFFDPVQQLTHIKLAVSAASRSVILNGVNKAAYEAEFAAAVGTTVNTDHVGYTGTGFVDGFETSGDSATFDMSANAAGSHQLQFRYGNGAATAATRTVYVDGASVGTLTLPALASWDSWGTATLTTTLTAGKHTVKISFDSGNTGGINLDNMTVARP